MRLQDETQTQQVLMAKGLQSILLLLVLAWLVAEVEAQDTFENFKWTHVIYLAPNSSDKDLCNKIMKKRGLDDMQTNTFINTSDDKLIKICRTAEGQELNMKIWSSFLKLPLIMCRSRDEEDSDSTNRNYITRIIKEAILVKCKNGMPVEFLGTGTVGLGR
ncbi:UNVERIFIED_CONTAM: hypothetical protein K2H54_035572 [Gekko kuhli]